jgi:hypothetical protein
VLFAQLTSLCGLPLVALFGSGGSRGECPFIGARRTRIGPVYRTADLPDATPNLLISSFDFAAATRCQAPRRRNPLRETGDLLSRINVIWPVQSCVQKDSASGVGQINFTTPAVPSPLRGVSRSSRTWAAGCGGRKERQRRGRLLRTAKSCGPDAPTLASSRWRQLRRRRWQTSPVTGESTK